EIQIRTHDMHRVAEFGIASHWRYKEGEKKDTHFEERIGWLRQLVEWHRELSGAEEFLESVKTDIFNDQVFVYTPKGEKVMYIIKVFTYGRVFLHFLVYTVDMLGST
ncbi:unnamed protein product, partial [marine sediment metagenome]